MQHLTLAAGVMAVALASAAAIATPSATAAPRSYASVGQEPDGKAVYLKNCKQCHGVLGEPTKTAKAKYDKIPSFQDPEFFKKHTHDEMIDAITKGKGEMKGFAEKLSKEEIPAVLEYIHTLRKAS